MTGDQLTEALLPVLQALIMAVHTGDQDGVAATFNRAAGIADDPWTALKYLAVMGAALGRPDLPLSVQLGWTDIDQRSA